MSSDHTFNRMFVLIGNLIRKELMLPNQGLFNAAYLGIAAGIILPHPSHAVTAELCSQQQIAQHAAPTPVELTVAAKTTRKRQ